MRRLVLGTAGHVDHGKTTLVRALTGVDTDRLEEEHRRGISIELGFAPLRLADDVELGVVDVPGHERFVRQMVAGAGGMDLAMLVVAADEGPMPQTREHLEVLRALGVRAGLCVLARCDLAGPDITAVVEAELAELVAGSFLEGAPVQRVVAPTGEGLEELRAALLELARATPPRRQGGDFRLPVDRSFVLEGTGVVVAGTAWQGELRVGDRLRLLPADRPVRVRELQRHGAAADRAGAGERVAIALHGVERGEVARGDQLVQGPAFAPSDRLGVALEGLRAPGAPLRQGARVHVHHAAREVAGRVELLELDGGPVDRRSELAPGRQALARLRLEAPLVAAPGDRLVLRRWSPMATLAGGVVLEPDDAGAMRGGELRERLRTERREGPAGWPLRWLAQRGRRGATPEALLGRFARQGVGPDEATGRLAAAVAAGDAVELGGTVLASPCAQAVLAEALGRLREHQAAQPLSPGLGREELRQALGLELPPPALERLLQHWAATAPLFLAGDRVRADEPAPGLDPAQERALQRLEGEVEAAGFVAQLDQPTWVGPELRLLVQQGRLHKLVPRLVVHPARLAALRDELRAHFAAHEELAVADLKAITGQSRKFVVPLLEHCDALGWTRFDGGARRAGPALHGA